MIQNENEIDANTLVQQRFAQGQGVVMLSSMMTDEQILTLIKSACTWSKGKAFKVALYPVADVSQLKDLHVDDKSSAAIIANTIKVF